MLLKPCQTSLPMLFWDVQLELDDTFVKTRYWKLIKFLESKEMIVNGAPNKLG